MSESLNNYIEKWVRDVLKPTFVNQTPENTIGAFREKLGETLAGGLPHLSSCAVHNAPAYEPGPCDCGLADRATVEEG